MRLLSRSLACATIVAGVLFAAASQSQVVPAIKGGGAQANVYGFYTLMNPDGKSGLEYPRGYTYPAATVNRYGMWNKLSGGIGGDFRLGRFIFGQPAVGARVTFSSSNSAKETTYLFGPEMHYEFGRLRPYGNFFIGPGDITWLGNGFKDNSIVYDVGGGLDYHINHRFNVRLVDFQYQFWNLGAHFYPANWLPGIPAPAQTVTTTLRPYSLNFGLTVRVW